MPRSDKEYDDALETILGGEGSAALRTLVLSQESIRLNQEQNTQSIKQLSEDLSSVSKDFREITIELKGVVVEFRHIRTDVDEIKHEIHGEGGIKDQLIDVRLSKQEDTGVKKVLKYIIVSIVSFVSSVLLIKYFGN